MNPNGPAAETVIAGLRDRLARGRPGSLVGGGPAIQYDTTQAARHDALLLIPLVLLGDSGHHRAAPAGSSSQSVVLVATTALSFAASFGLANLLFRDGLGYPGIESQIPLYIFIFLVALGVDYNIFLSARIREESRRPACEGTLLGLVVTGGVITAAGIVLAGTFAALTRLPNASVAEVGIAVALGVLLDTLLVRTVLVPAAFLSIGQRVWWPARSAREAEDIGVSVCVE